MKRLFSICLAICMVLLVACKGEDVPTSSRPPVQTAEGVTEVSEPDVVIQGIHQVGTAGGAELSVSAPKGYYELASIFPSSNNIIYTDYATNKQLFLCARPECTHDNETCLSYIDLSKGNLPGLIYTNNKLLVITPASINNSYVPSIVVMNPDGSERKTLIEFKANQNIGTGQFLADAENLYFIMEDIKNDGSYTSQLCSVNLTTGKLTTIVDTAPREYLYDGYEDTIYLKILTDGQAPERDLFETEDEYQEALLKTKVHQIVSLNINNPKTRTTLDEWQHESLWGRMIDGVFYYHDASNDTINMRNYITNETETVQNTTGNAMIMFDAREIIDGKLVFNAVDSISDDSLVLSYYVDFNAGTVKPISLMNNWNRPIYICGEYDGRLYVQYEVVEESYMGEFDGVMTEYNVVTLRLGHLTIEDYFNSTPNYVPTERVY